MKSIPMKYSPETQAVHAGEYLNDTRGHVGPIYQTSTFLFSDAAEGRELFAHEKSGYIYTRLGNPTVELMEQKVATLEGRGLKLKAQKEGKDVEVYCRAFASGMSAISSIAFTALSAGDHLIADTILYGCTNDLFDNLLPRFGIGVDFVDCSDLQALEKALSDHPNTKMVFLETPGNPTMKLCDIAAVAELCSDKALLVVDNTFATPILQRPLELGADIVMHSGTKYLSGHGNVISGLAIGTDADFFEKMHALQIDTGGVPSPFDSWLLNTGLKTLPLRMKRHCENAMKIADFLDHRAGISRVLYPACENFPQKELAEKQMDGYGGVIAFEVEGGYERAQVVLNSTKLFSLAVSLGCVDSLIEHPFTMTHAVVPEEVKKMHNITPGLIRIAVGIESADDLIDDLDRALGNNGAKSHKPFAIDREAAR